MTNFETATLSDWRSKERWECSTGSTWRRTGSEPEAAGKDEAESKGSPHRSASKALLRTRHSSTTCRSLSCCSKSTAGDQRKRYRKDKLRKKEKETENARGKGGSSRDAIAGRSVATDVGTKI